VIEMSGAVALWIAGGMPAGCRRRDLAAAGLLAVGAVFVPYLTLLGLGLERLERLRLPIHWRRWLTAAISEEGASSSRWRSTPAVEGLRDVASGRDSGGGGGRRERRDGAHGLEVGARHGVAEIVTARSCSLRSPALPNAVAAVYLAARGRGAAVLSTALNSNGINVIAGLLVPATLTGLGAPRDRRPSSPRATSA